MLQDGEPQRHRAGPARRLPAMQLPCVALAGAQARVKHARGCRARAPRVLCPALQRLGLFIIKVHGRVRVALLRAAISSRRSRARR